MKDVRFGHRTPFSVITTVVHRGAATSAAYIELTLTSGSIRLTFRDSESLRVLTNAFTQLAADAERYPRYLSQPAVRTCVFSRDIPDGNPRHGADLFPDA